jgi:hypothetical protein
LLCAWEAAVEAACCACCATVPDPPDPHALSIDASAAPATSAKASLVPSLRAAALITGSLQAGHCARRDVSVPVGRVNRAVREASVDVVIRGVRVGVVEDIERAFVLAHVDPERLAASCVEDDDPEPAIDLGPQQADLEADRQAAVDFAYRDEGLNGHVICFTWLICGRLAAAPLVTIVRTYVSLACKRVAAPRFCRTWGRVHAQLADANAGWSGWSATRS